MPSTTMPSTFVPTTDEINTSPPAPATTMTAPVS
jgi:hypothetical protein